MLTIYNLLLQKDKGFSGVWFSMVISFAEHVAHGVFSGEYQGVSTIYRDILQLFILIKEAESLWSK